MQHVAERDILSGDGADDLARPTVQHSTAQYSTVQRDILSGDGADDLARPWQ